MLINFEFVIVFDIISIYDIVGIIKGIIVIGKGVVIRVKDGGMMVNL